MAKLTGPQIESLTDLLTDTLSDYDFQTTVHVSTGDDVFSDYTSPLLPKRQQIRQTLQELERSGTTPVFLGEVYRRRPQRPDVQAFIVEVAPQAIELDPAAGPELSLQQGGAAVADAPPFAGAPGLQRNVRPHLGYIDLGTWPEELAERRARICRVEMPDGSTGTGFLVGPSAVLTNWHVVRGHLDPGQRDRIACRFDYASGKGGAAPAGRLVKLGPGGILDSSPCSDAELKTNNPDQPPPGPHELDYALLDLAEPVGNDRGFERLPEDPPFVPEGTPLLILQHPSGGKMKLAMDTDAVIGRKHGDLRLRYKTNTEPGSSGSPCFTMDWTLVALHHLGDPAFRAAFNQGVSIELVRKMIVGRGQSAALAL